MKLVEFLLNNWYLAIVAFFLLSSFLKRAKGGAGGQTPKQAMPPFGGGGPGWGSNKAPTISTAKRPDQGHKNTHAASKATNRDPVPYGSSEPPGHTVEQNVWDDPHSTGTRHVNEALDRTIRTSEPDSQQIRPDTANLAQGIMWAEILGPPRAKKPYRKIK